MENWWGWLVSTAGRQLPRDWDTAVRGSFLHAYSPHIYQNNGRPLSAIAK
jgi:hypothetical protein